jgi:hypothetical protein
MREGGVGIHRGARDRGEVEDDVGSPLTDGGVHLVAVGDVEHGEGVGRAGVQRGPPGEGRGDPRLGGEVFAKTATQPPVPAEDEQPQVTRAHWRGRSTALRSRAPPTSVDTIRRKNRTWPHASKTG